mgnify:CR=1 FL=1
MRLAHLFEVVCGAAAILALVLLAMLVGIALSRADTPPKQCYQVCYPNGRCWTVCP